MRHISIIVLTTFLMEACSRENPASIETRPFNKVDAGGTPAPVVASMRQATTVVVSASFSITGQLAEIVVKTGDWVEAGQYLGRLDSSEIEQLRERRLREYQESEHVLEVARMTYLNLKQQAEAVPVSEEQMRAAEENVVRVSASRAQALDALRQEQAASQRGILYAPRRGMVEAVLVEPGSRIESSQVVISLRCNKE